MTKLAGCSGIARPAYGGSRQGTSAAIACATSGFRFCSRNSAQSNPPLNRIQNCRWFYAPMSARVMFLTKNQLCWSTYGENANAAKFQTDRPANVLKQKSRGRQAKGTLRAYAAPLDNNQPKRPEMDSANLQQESRSF